MVISVVDTPATLVCDVCMTPSGTFSWVKEDGEIPEDNTQEDNMLTIHSVGEDDFGVYICTATNAIQSIIYRNSFAINLIQQGPPGQATDLAVEASTSVSLTIGWTCGHHGGDDNMWFELYIVHQQTRRTICTL